jgi:outer membrane autotransporter protein
VSVAKSNFDLANDLGAGESDVLQAAGYGRIQFTPNIYGNFAGALSLSSVSTTRDLSISGSDTLKGQVDALVFSGRYETGIKLGSVAPYFALQNELSNIPAYTESASSGASTFALQYQSRMINSATLELGARQSTELAIARAWNLELTDRFAWSHNMSGRSISKASFIALPGSDFTTFGATPSKDAALISIGAQLKNRKGLSLNMRLDSAISSKSQSYTGMGGLRFSW